MKEGGRSALERERTKMRERQRRSITSNIFQGLRKHGGYRLSPRADINEVIRHLAQEAGWIVHPDGTTYRSTTPAISNLQGTKACPLCGGGGECSTSTMPRRVVAGGGAAANNLSSNDTLLGIYMNGAPSNAGQQLHEPTVSNQNSPAGSA